MGRTSSPGKPLGSWYDPVDIARAHPFGQYVSALARMYASTKDVRYNEKEARLVHGFYETLAPDWAVKNLPRRKDEWYTLPENLYNCYALTKDPR